MTAGSLPPSSFSRTASAAKMERRLGKEREREHEASTEAAVDEQNYLQDFN